MIPEVSVIMPVHNAKRFVGEAIESVLKQSFGSFELLLIDDGSTDGTSLELQKFAKYDSRIRLSTLAVASGSPATPRNRGLDLARGKYVAFLDSDDVWYPEKLELQTSFMKEARAVVSYTGYERISEDGMLLKRVHVPQQLNYRGLLKNSAIANSSAMFDRRVAGSERFLQVGHEDFAFWLGMVKQYNHCYGLDEALLKYRVVQKSVSSKKLKSIYWVWNIYRQIEYLSTMYAFWCLLHYGVRAVGKRL